MKLMPEGCEGLSAEEEGALTVDTIFSAVIVYFLAMSVYNQKYLKRRGWEVIPHAIHLKQISELVEDGLKFSYANISGKTSARAVPTERTALLGGGSGERRGSRASQASQVSKRSNDFNKETRSSSSKAKTASKKEQREKSSKEKTSKSKSSKISRGDGGNLSPPGGAGPTAGLETAVEKQQRLLHEHAVADPAVHSSQQKIKVVSLTQSVTL
jgi:hypothetical protein